MNEALANANNPSGAGFGKDARRSARLDGRRVGEVHAMGPVAEGLRPSEGKEGKAAKRARRGERDEKEYVIDVPLRVFKVLEALEGRNFEPASIKRITQRTGFSADFCRRALLTLKAAGYAKQTLDGWIVGPKLVRFASQITAVHSAMAERQ
jgi:hypothetical protein